MSMLQEMKRLKAENEALKTKEVLRANKRKELKKRLRQLQLEQHEHDEHGWRRLQEQEQRKEEDVQELSTATELTPHQQQEQKVKQHAATKEKKKISRTSSTVPRTASTLLLNDNYTKEKRADNKHEKQRRSKAPEALLESEIQICERKCMDLLFILRQHQTQDEMITIRRPGGPISGNNKGDATSGRRYASMLVEECGKGSVVVKHQKEVERGQGKNYRHSDACLLAKDTRPVPDQPLPSKTHSSRNLEKRPSSCANNEVTPVGASSRSSRRNSPARMNLLVDLKKQTASTIDSHSIPVIHIQSRHGNKSFGVRRGENTKITKPQQVCYGMGESVLIKPTITRRPSHGGILRQKGNKNKDGSITSKIPLQRRKGQYTADQQFLDLLGAGILPLPCSTSNIGQAESTSTRQKHKQEVQHRVSWDPQIDSKEVGQDQLPFDSSIISSATPRSAKQLGPRMRHRIRNRQQHQQKQNDRTN
jgi:hypothetical protein